MVRLLRFAQKNESVACVIHTLEQSRDIAAFMIFMLTIVVIVFASFAYNVEQGNWDNTLGCYVRPGESFCSPFVSIPQAMWWCIVTVMMVGYGDIVPTTIPGKIFASIACVTGVLAVALPVSVLGANFSTKMVAHRNQVKKQQAIDRARKQGINGVVQSRARVLQALRSFNNANSNTLELGNVAVRETISMHHRTWTEYLKSFSSCPKALESLQGTATIDPVTGMRSVEMVARIGKPELFSCLEQDIFREIDMGLSEVFSLIEDTADIAQRMRKKIEYINWLKQNTNVQLESHWETVQQQVEETRQVCERMASSMQNDPVTGVTTPKSRKSHKGD